jgi:hypothetical protein
MNTSFRLTWLFAGILLAFAVIHEVRAASNYSESYVILIRKSIAGTETVTEKTDAGGNTVSTSEHEMLVSEGPESRSMKFSTRMVLSKSTWLPASYSYWYTYGGTGDSYELTVANGQITRVLNRGGKTSDLTIPLEPNMVVVDFNVYHQYDYLVRKYDLKKGGRQTFADFIPIIANDIPIGLTFMGDGKVSLKNGGTIDVRNFKTEFVGIWSGTLTTTRDGRLVRLLIPAQDIEVLRRDLLGE